MDKFKKIYIEISNICNLQCSFCPEVERGKKIMAADDFEIVIGKVKDHTEQVTLHLMGEPLAHPEFSKIVAMAEEQGVHINLTTNGLLLKRYKEKELLSPAVRQINFSVQSYKDNFPNRPLKDYLTPLLEFTKFLNERRPETYINFRLWNLGNDAAHENEEVLSLIEEFYQVEINRRVDPGLRKSKRVWERVYLHFDSRFDWPSPLFPKISEQGKCYGLDNHIGIHANGDVVPCCLDKEARIKLGNIKENTLEDILNAPRALAMKKGFEQGRLVEDLCQRCSYIRRF
jgi:radical SAM protein with 4Fe4S-binding SPASM domain